MFRPCQGLIRDLNFGVDSSSNIALGDPLAYK